MFRVYSQRLLRPKRLEITPPDGQLSFSLKNKSKDSSQELFEKESTVAE